MTCLTPKYKLKLWLECPRKVKNQTSPICRRRFSVAWQDLVLNVEEQTGEIKRRVSRSYRRSNSQKTTQDVSSNGGLDIENGQEFEEISQGSLERYAT